MNVGAVARLKLSLGGLLKFFMKAWWSIAFGPVPIRPEKSLQFGSFLRGQLLDGLFDLINRAHEKI